MLEREVRAARKRGLEHEDATQIAACMSTLRLNCHCRLEPSQKVAEENYTNSKVLFGESGTFKRLNSITGDCAAVQEA